MSMDDWFRPLDAGPAEPAQDAPPPAASSALDSMFQPLTPPPPEPVVADTPVADFDFASRSFGFSELPDLFHATRAQVFGSTPEETQRILANAGDQFTPVTLEGGVPGVEYGGTQYPINTEGFSGADIANFAGDVAMFAPGARLASTVGSLGKAVAAGFTADSITEGLRQLFGMAQGSGASGEDAAWRTGVAGASGGAGVWAGDLLSRFYPKSLDAMPDWLGRFLGEGDAAQLQIPTRSLDEGELFARMGLDPANYTAAERGAVMRQYGQLSPQSRTGIASGNEEDISKLAHGLRVGMQDEGAENLLPMSYGQATGNPDALRQEDMLRGSEAVNEVRARDVLARDQIGRVTQTAPPEEIGSALQQQSGDAFQQARREAGRPYDELRETLRNESRALRTYESAEDMLNQRLEGVAERYTVDDPSFGVAGAYTDVAKLPGEDIRTFENVRQKITREINSAERGSAKQSALMSIRRAADGWLDETIDAGLYTGDRELVRQVKAARSAYRRFKQTWGEKDNPAGKILAKLREDGVTGTEAMKALYGASELGATRNTSEAVRRLANIPTVRESLREGAFSRMFRAGPENPGRMASHIREAVDGSGSRITDTLFDEAQRRELLRFADELDRYARSGARNPSRTSYAVIDQMLQNLPIVGGMLQNYRLNQTGLANRPIDRLIREFNPRTVSAGATVAPAAAAAISDDEWNSFPWAGE